MVVRTFESIPELASAGILAGSNALYLEHIRNPMGRFSMDIDLQNQTEDIETIHRRFSPETRKQLVLVSRVSDEMYEYRARIGQHTVRIEIARPYLRHRKRYKPSRNVPRLVVISLADLLFAKVSAFSTRGFARDLIDLFAIDQQRTVDWRKLLDQAAQAPDNDYNPTEFHRNLKWHDQRCIEPDYADELPVTGPPATAVLRAFIQRLLDTNQAVARETLEGLRSFEKVRR